MARLRQQHGSVMDYVRDERLRWTDLDAKGRAFEDPGMFDFFSHVFFFLRFLFLLLSFKGVIRYLFSPLFFISLLTKGRGWRVGDVKIIFNDWPYGIDKSIVHLCVWTKFPLDVDEADPNGDLTPEMRRKIDAYVATTFGSRVPAENVSSSSSPFYRSSVLRCCVRLMEWAGQDHLVQELGEAEIHPFHGAFPRPAQGPGSRIPEGDHGGGSRCERDAG